jgi:hypothetical protein
MEAGSRGIFKVGCSMRAEPLVFSRRESQYLNLVKIDTGKTRRKSEMTPVAAGLSGGSRQRLEGLAGVAGFYGRERRPNLAVRKGICSILEKDRNFGGRSRN